MTHQAKERIQLLERELRGALDALTAVAELIRKGQQDNGTIVLRTEDMDRCTTAMWGIVSSRMASKGRA